MHLSACGTFASKYIQQQPVRHAPAGSRSGLSHHHLCQEGQKGARWREEWRPRTHILGVQLRALKHGPRQTWCAGEPTPGDPALLWTEVLCSWGLPGVAWLRGLPHPGISQQCPAPVPSSPPRCKDADRALIAWGREKLFLYGCPGCCGLSEQPRNQTQSASHESLEVREQSCCAYPEGAQSPGILNRRPVGPAQCPGVAGCFSQGPGSCMGGHQCHEPWV